MHTHSKLAKSVRLAVAFSAVSTLSIPLCANAQSSTQDAADDVERIAVTGSRIKRSDIEGAAPIISLGADEIAKSGAVNLGDLLNELPALGSTFSLGNSSRFIGTTGLNLLDLRRLGTARTLVLVNGKRHVAGNVGTSAVDVNTIPTDWVERVEVITGGASAVYGADAVTGVVNFILKDSIEGLNARVQYGDADDSGFSNYLFSLNGGGNFADDKGNAAFSLEFGGQDSLPKKDRPLFAVPTRLVNNPEDGDTGTTNDGIPDEIYARNAGLHLITNGGVFYTFANGGPVFGALQPWVFDSNGNFRQQNLGTNYGSFECGDCDFVDLDAVSELQPQFDRVAFNSKFNYAFRDDLSFYLEAKYNRTTSGSFGQPTFSFGFGPFGPSEYVIPRDNAYISDSLGQLMDDNGLSSIDLSRFNVDAGLRIEDVERQTVRGVAGIKGYFADDWEYDIYANWGQTKSEQLNLNNMIVPRFLAAIDAVVDPSSGDIVCRSTIDPDTDVPDYARDGCIPTSIFGDGAVNQASADWFNASSITVNTITQTNFAAIVSNASAFQNWAGDIGFAAGLEYRKERSLSQPDQLAALGVTFLNALQEEKGDYDVNEAFVEFSVPLLSGYEYTEDLILDLAARWADYSTIGSDTSWKVGLDWTVVKGMKVRGTMSKAVRAPNISELFGPQNQNFFNVDDPCSVDEIPDAQDAAVRQANCTALGAPAGFDSLTDDATLEGISGGNPDLQAEESDSVTIGLVYSPEYVEGLSLVVDYWEIEIEDAISNVGAQDILDKCVDDPSGIDNQFCALVTRGPDFEITSIEQITQNVAAFEASGVDFELGYNFDAWGGEFRTKLVGTKLNKNRSFPFQNDPDTPDDERGELGDPEWLANATLSYDYGNWSASWELRYIDSMLLIENEEYAVNPDARNVLFTGSQFYNDVQVNYRYGDNWRFYAGADNIFDRDVPAFLDGTGGGSSIFDNIGRLYYAGASFTY